jgi:hypothetical protein
MAGILKEPTSEGVYGAAGGDAAAFLGSWGSSTFNEPRIGFGWSMYVPLSIPESIRPEPVPIPTGGGAVVAPPYTYARYLIERESVGTPNFPLLHVRIAGNGRLANATFDTSDLRDAWFCLRNKCECPKGTEGTPPPAPPIGKPLAALALSGGRSGTVGALGVASLDEYCKKKDEKPDQPPPAPPVGSGGGAGSSGAPGCSNGCGTSNGDPHLTTFDGFLPGRGGVHGGTFDGRQSRGAAPRGAVSRPDHGLDQHGHRLTRGP